MWSLDVSTPASASSVSHTPLLVSLPSFIPLFWDSNKEVDRMEAAHATGSERGIQGEVGDECDHSISDMI